MVVSGSVFNVEAGQVVTLSLNGSDYTAVVNDDLSWSLSLPSSLWAGVADGMHTLDASVTSIDGNNAYASRVIRVDINAPVVTIDSVAGDDVISGPEQHAGQVISGTANAEQNQVVDVTFNGRTYQTGVDAVGAWQVNVDSRDFLGTADGAYNITAVVVDKAGNAGVTSRAVHLQADGPMLTIDGFTADNILSQQEQSAVQVISGTSSLGAGDAVAINLNGKDYSATVQSDQSWSVLLGTADLAALADSTVYRISATATDNLGNSGSADHSFSVDLSGPMQGLTIDSISDDSGSSSSDFITSDTLLAINGTLSAPLVAGEAAQISLDNGASWINLAVSGVTWTYPDSRVLTDGNYDYQVRLIDAVGNVGTTASQLVIVDTQAPVLTIEITGITDDNGPYQDYITNDTSLTIRGTLSSPLTTNQMAQISLDNGATWTTFGIAGTAWRYVDARTLTEGAYNYSVRVVDMAGNIASTDTQTIQIDSTAPATTIHLESITDDTGVSATDFITRDNSLVLNGSLSAALTTQEVAQISTDNGATWTHLATTGQTWSYADGRALADGVYIYQVRVLDFAGNSGAIAQQAVRVDSSAPGTLIGVERISDDTGVSGTDFITSDTSIRLSGHLSNALATDEYAQISIDGGSTWNTLTDVSGTYWTYDDSRLLTDGSHSYQLRVVDEAGNLGPVAAQGVVVDTNAPSQHVIISGYDDDQGARQGLQSSLNITDDTAPILRGTLDAPLQGGDVLKVFQNGIYVGNASVSGTSWEYALNGLVSGNDYQYSALVIDAAGNVGAAADYLLSVDTRTPNTVMLEPQVTADNTPVLRGTVANDWSYDYVLYVTVNGKTYASNSSQGDGRVVIDPANNTWYLQIPDSDALAINNYDVTTEVVDEAGNGSVNSQTFTGSQAVVAEVAIDTQWAMAAAPSRTDQQTGLSYAIGKNGLWTFVANTAVYSSIDLNSYDTDILSKEAGIGNTVNYSFFDLDRDGDMDIFASQSFYVRPFQYWQNDNGSFTSKTIAYGGLDSFYGATVAYDRTGNGYLDLVLGDSNLDGNSAGWFINNQDATFSQDTVTRNLNPAYTFGASVSGVDINNDGTIDIAAQISGGGGSSYFALGVFTNPGDGTMAISQVLNNVFNDGGGTDNVGTSMTWADFNGDGTLDLYLNQHYLGYDKSALLINNNGVLDNFVEINAGTDIRSRISLAVDWDHNGTLDIAKMGGYNGGDTIQLILNNGNGLSWTNANLGYSYGSRLTGAGAIDYNWDGAVDLLGFTSTGHSFVVENTNAVADGTALHLRIFDKNGINAFYGNTVQLFDSSGALVATQSLNPQSGVGVNDSSALLSFYGLNANESYSAQLIRIVEGVRADVNETVNASWGGLSTAQAQDSYVLSAESDGDSNNGVFIGTGYNDTFVATAGSDTYNGAGGWSYNSGHATWTAADGGMDVVDYKLATSGVSVDLSTDLTQNTGFNSARLVDIEGLAGSRYADTLTGSAADNQLEGREGNDTFNIANGGHDTLIYKLLSAADATAGNGSDVVNGFTVGTWEGTDDSDRIDISELLQDTAYAGTGSASYVDGVATLDAAAGNLEAYLKVVQNGANTNVQFDHDGAGTAFDPSTVISLSGVHVDMATLLANHQLLVA